MRGSPYAVHVPRLLNGVLLPAATLTPHDKPVYSRDSEQATRSMQTRRRKQQRRQCTWSAAEACRKVHRKQPVDEAALLSLRPLPLEIDSPRRIDETPILEEYEAVRSMRRVL